MPRAVNQAHSTRRRCARRAIAQAPRTGRTYQFGSIRNLLVPNSRKSTRPFGTHRSPAAEPRACNPAPAPSRWRRGTAPSPQHHRAASRRSGAHAEPAAVRYGTVSPTPPSHATPQSADSERLTSGFALEQTQKNTEPLSPRATQATTGHTPPARPPPEWHASVAWAFHPHSPSLLQLTRAGRHAAAATTGPNGAHGRHQRPCAGKVSGRL